jgi:hypothetical protein
MHRKISSLQIIFETFNCLILIITFLKKKKSWVSSTYNIPLDEDIPHSESDRKVKMLKYYQWTPFILLFQALLFYLPRMIWRSLNDKSGLDIQGIILLIILYCIILLILLYY